MAIKASSTPPALNLNPIGVIDSHCHLDRYENPTDIIERAHNVGVDTLLSISTSRRNFESVISIAHHHPYVYASAGIHPCDVHLDPDPDTLYQWLCNHASNPKVIGLGETGLDQQATSPDLCLQKKIFDTHIQASITTQLPLIVHTRNSDATFLDVMDANTHKPRGVLHCFTGGIPCAKKAVNWGWKVSLSGILTFKNGQAVRDMAKALPLEALLIETDAPWLAPQSKRGQMNEPAYILETLGFLADIHGKTTQEMAAITTLNFFNLFQKIAP